MKDWSAENWRALIDAAPEGILICDAAAPDMPIVYANEAFTQLSGYSTAALLGKNPRMLQGNEADQEGKLKLREALERGSSGRAMLRNYRPDGSMFWNEVMLQPVRDASGELTHWIAYHRNAGDRGNEDRDTGDRGKGMERAPQGLPSWMRDDRLTGLHARGYFEELLRRDWQIAQREEHQLCLVIFDIDELAAYNDTFDRSAGDACIRRIARVVAASYRRGSDLLGRLEGGTFSVLTQGDTSEKAAQYAKVVAQRVRDLLIHHPRANAGRFVSVSAGVAAIVPPRTRGSETLLEACKVALKRAKAGGKNAIVTALPGDFGLD